MELREIANITYELYRVKQDRLCMEYEDQLSFMIRKYTKLNKLLGEKKKQFDSLLEQVLQNKGISSKSDGKTEKGKEVKISQQNPKLEESRKSPVKAVNSSNFKGREEESKDKPKIEDISAGTASKESLVINKKRSPEDEKLASKEIIMSFFDNEPLNSSPVANVVKKKESSKTPPSTPNLDSKKVDKSFFDTKTKPNKRPFEQISSPSPSKNAQTSELTLVPKYKPQTSRLQGQDSPNRADHDNLVSKVSDQSPIQPMKDDALQQTKIARKSIELPPRPKSATSSTIQSTSISTAAHVSSSTGGQSSKVPPKKSKSVLKSVEVVRKRAERDALPGFQCNECAAFYNAQVKQGILDPSQMKEFLQLCSRHKAKYTPPDTPEGFWDLTLRTPDEWKT